MSNRVYTEYSDYTSKITYEISNDGSTIYRFVSPMYSGTEIAAEQEHNTVKINSAKWTSEDRLGLCDVLNMVLFDLRLKQVGSCPNKSYDRAIDGVIMALNALSEK